VGEVAPQVLGAFGIDERVAILEIDLDQFLAREPKPAQWKPTSRQPSSDLDLAFVLSDEVEAERLDRAIRQGAGTYLVDLHLFDVYRGSGVADGARSLAYRLRLQALERSLTDQDIADVRRGVEAAAVKLGAELRG
jgi:phenylalanyl-tRNA synthetase beta chain